jgi:pyrrolidone-carboxylate peptidase
MPFRGRVKNGSQTIARYVQPLIKNGDVRIVEIPVRWGAVESVCTPVIQEWQPDVILGLGEGGAGILTIETIAKNMRKGDDVDGYSAPNEYILEFGENQRSCRFDFTWSPQIQLPVEVKISLDAGAYLCNNALYHFAGTLTERVGFIHIPPQENTDDVLYVEQYGPIVLEILHQNIPT